MYYLIIEDSNKNKMWWTGENFSFTKLGRKEFTTFDAAEKEYENIIKKYDYMKELILITGEEEKLTA